jgi:hypothetical protein
VKYLREHTIDGVSYEGKGAIEVFPDGVDLIHDLIDKYGPELKIVAGAPLIDLAKAAERDVDNFCRIGGLYIQGNAVVKRPIFLARVLLRKEEQLVPDAIAYNIRKDIKAAKYLFKLQNRIPFTIVTPARHKRLLFVG